MIQLLTVTGERPMAFSLCQRWMRRQDYDGRVVWIVVDDGTYATEIEPMPENWDIVRIRPYPYWRPGENTQVRNLKLGLDQVDPRVPLAIIEDDDWYSPRWISTVLNKLKDAALVGESPARYYNVSTNRGRTLDNEAHASLCATAMRDGATVCFRNIVSVSDGFLDVQLWQAFNDSHLFWGNNVVGIKGLPGRPGIGMGHHSDFGVPDSGRVMLKRWIGEDVNAYV